MTHQQFLDLDEEERESRAAAMTLQERDALGISERGDPSIAAMNRHYSHQLNFPPLVVEVPSENPYQWRAVERFPETIGEAERFGYIRPSFAEEFEAEMPIDFPGYPSLGEVQIGESLARTTCDFLKHRFAVSQWVETRSRDGLIMSARWEWHARSGAPYRWVVGPRADRMPMERRDVDFWRPIDEVKDAD